MPSDFVPALLGPELIFVTGVVTFVNAVARLICPDLLGWCSLIFTNIYSGPSSFFGFHFYLKIFNL